MMNTYLCTSSTLIAMTFFFVYWNEQTYIQSTTHKHTYANFSTGWSLPLYHHLFISLPDAPYLYPLASETCAALTLMKIYIISNLPNVTLVRTYAGCDSYLHWFSPGKRDDVAMNFHYLYIRGPQLPFLRSHLLIQICHWIDRKV